MEMSAAAAPVAVEGPPSCPRCGGHGHIRDTESSALQILRIIQEESMKDGTAAVHVQVPVDVASFLLNEKRAEIAKIELKQRISVIMIPNKTLETPNYRLERLKHDDPRLDNLMASYHMAEEIEDPTAVTRRSTSAPQTGGADNGRLTDETRDAVATPPCRNGGKAALRPHPSSLPIPVRAVAPAPRDGGEGSSMLRAHWAWRPPSNRFRAGTRCEPRRKKREGRACRPDGRAGGRGDRGTCRVPARNGDGRRDGA